MEGPWRASHARTGASAGGHPRQARLAAAHRAAVRPLPAAPEPAAGADLPRLDPRRRLPVSVARSRRQGVIVHRPDTADLARRGMIALAVINGVISVAQTWISNQVGQRVMHDLRAAVYAHLQRMSLAFFTRTRSGEVQARIAYDIGGIDDVVTSTATSTVSTVATVIATIVAMFALSWRADGLLADAAAVLRVAHAPCRQRAPAHPVGSPEPPGGHVDARGGVAVGVGDPARQDDGPLARARRPLLARSPANSPTSRCARAWRDAGGWPRSR